MSQWHNLAYSFYGFCKIVGFDIDGTVHLYEDISLCVGDYSTQKCTSF